MPASSARSPLDAAPPDAVTFEQALSRLEAIVESLEGDLPNLEEALQAYEEGVGLAQLCLERLRRAELRVQELALE